MATLILRCFEACAAIGNSDKSLVIDNVPIRSLSTVDMGTVQGSNYAKGKVFLMPFIDMKKLGEEGVKYLRESLPYLFRLEDNGLLWCNYGSQVERHYSLDHAAKMKEHIGEVTGDPSIDDCLPYEGYTARRKLMQRHMQSVYPGNNHQIAPNGMTVMGRSSVILSLSEDKHTYIEEHPTTTAPVIFFSFLFKTEALDDRMTHTLKWFTERHACGTTFGDIFSANLLGAAIVRVTKHKINNLVDSGPRMCNKLHLPFDGKKNVKTVKGRSVRIEDKDKEHIGSFKDFAYTRVHSDGTFFLRLGVKFGSDGTLQLDKLKPASSAMIVPTTELLVHKASDGWRLLLIMPRIVEMPPYRKEALGCVPMCYIIPQFVSRNEVTFSTKTFRGLPALLQKEIWSTQGMSMAIHRAFMGLQYELKRVAAIAPHYTMLYDDIDRMPKEHKIGLYGPGWCGRVMEGRVSDSPLLLNGAQSSGSRWDVYFETRRKKVIKHAIDMVDEMFFGLPKNELLLANEAYIKEERYNRSVRV